MNLVHGKGRLSRCTPQAPSPLSHTIEGPLNKRLAGGGGHLTITHVWSLASLTVKQGRAGARGVTFDYGHMITAYFYSHYCLHAGEDFVIASYNRSAYIWLYINPRHLFRMKDFPKENDIKMNLFLQGETNYPLL
jgi:hypothetical protein